MDIEICYFAKRSQILPDGTVRIDAAGSDEDGLWHGCYDVDPLNPEYEFWLWLRKR